MTFENQRVLHYILTANKNMKELEGIKVGHLQKEKIEVERNKTLDNILVNF